MSIYIAAQFRVKCQVPKKSDTEIELIILLQVSGGGLIRQAILGM
jgi:hypothetical protein